MTSPWIVELLSKRHKRDTFESGEPAIDDFLRKYARQNQDENIGRTFVATVEGTSEVVGFYTLTVASVAREQFDEALVKRVPRYPLPVAHLGRLAVSSRAQKKGLGEHLLLHALSQILRVSRVVGIFAVEVRAKHERARRFYAKYGFVSLKDDPLHMYLPISDIEVLATQLVSD